MDFLTSVRALLGICVILSIFVNISQTRHTLVGKNLSMTETKSNTLATIPKTEARGSTYSYYYTSRIMYYIPLYYLFYFATYLISITLRSAYAYYVRFFPGESKFKTFLLIWKHFTYRRRRPQH